MHTKLIRIASGMQRIVSSHHIRNFIVHKLLTFFTPSTIKGVCSVCRPREANNTGIGKDGSYGAETIKSFTADRNTLLLNLHNRHLNDSKQRKIYLGAT